MSKAEGVTLTIEATFKPIPTVEQMLSRVEFRAHVEHRLIGAQVSHFGQVVAWRFGETVEQNAACMTDSRDRVAMARDAYDAMRAEEES